MTDRSSEKISLDGKPVLPTEHNQTVLAVFNSLKDKSGKCGARGYLKGMKAGLPPHIYGGCEYALCEVRPDAWRIYEDEKENICIDLYEIEVHNRLSVDKIRDYTNIWFAFDCEDASIKVRLIWVFNRVEHEIPLPTHFFNSLGQPR